ncbi:hypothetical protein DA096_16460 [Vibrio rotiferianus]|nr:hypothetical protein DA095_06045 [Vibrio rotiferianus]TMX61491.1 hypothetical protein DA096_16460 [Vibrio rotiferianus]
MSLERHGDFAPIMLTNEPDETTFHRVSYSPKTGAILAMFPHHLKSESQRKLPFRKNSADKAVKIH